LTGFRDAALSRGTTGTLYNFVALLATLVLVLFLRVEPVSGQK